MSVERKAENDLSLMKRVKEGDRKAFESLYQLTAPELAAYLRRRLPPSAKDESADILQEVFVVAWRCAGNFREGYAVLGWLRGIARHMLFRRLRRRVDPVHVSDRELPAAEEPLGADMDLQELIRDVRKLVAQLPTAQRDAFEAVHIEGLSRAEAAVRLGCTLPQLRSRLYEARRSLRVPLEDRAP